MHLRRQDGIDDEEMVKSLNPSANRHQIFKANQGQKHNAGGKSGSFFFFTEDRQYIIKTIKKSELKKFLKSLPSICEYLYKNEERSYIQRIYGLFKIKMPSIEPFYIMVQRNALQLKPTGKLILTFDLKGSTYQRQVVP